MTLHAPFIISSRLLPALQIEDGTIQIQYSHTTLNRDHYKWTIDIPAGSFTGTDLSGHGGLQSMFESLLSFLGAAGESYRYQGLDWDNISEDDNATLFPRPVTEWAYQNSDEITTVLCEIEDHDAIED